MSDQTMLKHGNFARGLVNLQRGETSSALEAFTAAHDFPNALRQIPFILRDLNASPAEIMGAVIAAYDSGDLQALPWIIKFNDEFNFGHPDLKSFKSELKSLAKIENQPVLLGLMRIARESNDLKDYIKIMIRLIQLGNSFAKCELVNMVLQAPGYLSEYEALRKQQGKLPELNNLKPNFKEIPKGFGDESLGVEDSLSDYLDSYDFKYLEALLNQGFEGIASGAHIMKYFLDTRRRRFEYFSEYIQEVVESQDSRWEDPHFLLVFSTEIRTYAPTYDLTMFRHTLQSYGLEDFLDDLLNEVPEHFEESLFDDDSMFQISRAPSKNSPENAFNYFSKYSSSFFDEFINLFRNSPVAARKRYSEYMERAMSGEQDYFKPVAAVLEFVDRGYYDFDLVDPMLHELVIKKLPVLISANRDISPEFLEYLYRFEDGQAYFQDDIRRKLVRHPQAPASIREDFYKG